MKSKEKKTPQDDMSITDLLDVDDYINNSDFSDIQITNLPSSSNYDINSDIQNGKYTAPELINYLFDSQERNYTLFNGFNGTTSGMNNTAMGSTVHHLPEVILVSDALALLEISDEDRRRLLAVKKLNVGDNKEVKRLSEQLFKTMLKDIINTNTDINSDTNGNT